MKLGHWELELNHLNIYNQERQRNDKSGMIHFLKLDPDSIKNPKV